MLADVAGRFAMLSRSERLRWMAMAPLGLVTAALEGLGGALVFALLTLITHPPPGNQSPLVALINTSLAGAGLSPTITTLAACAALVHIARNVLLVGLAWWRTRVVAFDTAAMSTRLLAAYMSAPWPFHLRHGSAVLIENIHDSTRPFFEVFDAASIMMTETAVVLALSAIAIAVAPVAVSAAAAVIALTGILALRAARETERRGGARQFELGAALYRHVQHSLGALKEVRVLGRAGFFIDAFARDARASAALDTMRGALQAVPRLLLETMFIAGLLALTIVEGRRDQAAVLPLVSVYAYIGFRLVPTAHRIAQQISSLRWNLSASESLTRDLDRIEHVGPPRIEADARLILRDRIEANGVSFTYDGAAGPVLRDVSLTVSRGESVAIVGATGSGKTTLLDILIGLLTPSTGCVTVDGAPIAHGLPAWQARIGYVPQTPYLLDDTLRRNIAIGLEDADIDEGMLARAVAMARLDGVAAALTEGLDTMVGERGIRLSGGERQRVAIARALYRDPALVIFDEATSALDPATEREVAEAIDALRGARTVIVVSHRLKTVERCDRILLLSGGRITASGSYLELAASSDAFRQLAALT
jgi:ATP-binding cassette, subfamily B, bacterial PglK